MDNESYQHLSAKTASNSLHPQLVDNYMLQLHLRDLAATAGELDKHKKALFYGKGEPCAGVPAEITPTSADLFHAVLGICSEAGELAELLLDHMNGAPLDTANAVEELGDHLWYVAMLCRWLNTTISVVMAKNISKLRARYPDGFSEAAAVNRDLRAEQLALDLDP